MSLMLCKTQSQGDQILVCYSANCLCMGITVCGNILSFLERMIIRSFSFYKNILENTVGEKKISDHKFYMCFSCFKKKTKAKQKQQKNNKKEFK